MATGSSRDVKLTLSVATLGEENVRKLEAAVDALKAAGGGAGPAFEELTNQLAKISKESAAVDTFRQLSDATETLRARQEQLSGTAAKINADLTELRTTTRAATTEQKEAASALQAGQKAYVDSGNAIRILKTEYDSAGKKTEEYRAELNRLTVEQANAKSKLVDLNAAQKTANSEAAAASAAQSKLEGSYAKTSARLVEVEKSLSKQESVLRGAATAAEDLGVSTTNIAAAEAKLVQSLQATQSAAVAMTAGLNAAKEAEKALTAQADLAAQKLAERNKFAQDSYLADTQAAQAAQAAAAAFEKQAAALAEETRLSAAAAAAKQEQADSDRLAAIQKLALLDLQQRAAVALEAEGAAQREAAAGARAYGDAQAQAMSALKASADGAATAATDAANKIRNAFGTIGVRSAEELQAEIAQVREAMRTVGATSEATGGALRTAFSAGTAKINELERELRGLNGTLTTADRAAGLFKNSLGQIAAGNIIADGVGYLVNKVKELASAFVSTIADTERYRRALKAIYGDSAVAATQFENLRAVALRAGVSVGGIAESFIKFSAATKTAGVPLQVTNDLFEAVTRAAGTLGLKADDVTGILEALGQMASKGVVSMEELRQQLGDRLPGALGLAAQGLGITQGQLIKLVEAGSLAARDLFPALTKALGTMQGEVTGITPAFENLKTALFTTAQVAGDSGWTALLATGLKGVALVAGTILIPLNALGEIIFGLAKVSGILTAALFTLTNPTKALGEVVSEAAKRQALLNDTFRQAVDGADTANKSTSQLAAETTKYATIVATATATTYSSAKAQEIDALAKKLAADNTLDLATKHTQLGVAISQVLPSLTAAAQAADKEEKAVKETGVALVASAILRGNQVEILQTQAAASEANAVASEKSLAAHKAETEILTIQKNELLALSAVSEEEKRAREQQLLLIDKHLVKSQAETEQAKASVETTRQDVLARKVAIATYGDQSASVDKLRREMDEANSTAASVAIFFRQGQQSIEQYRVASDAATLATAKYNDALRDVGQQITATSALEQANYQVKLSGLGVSEQAYNQLAQVATASGDYASALYYEIEAKKIQIQITELTAAAKKAEAEATRLSIEAEKAQLIATGQLTDIKKLELEARLANAKAKEIEAGASEIVIRGLNAEIDAINNKFRVAQNERNQTAQGIATTNRDTGARLANAESIDEQSAALERKRLQVDKEGFSTDKNGGRLVAGGDLTTRTGIVAFLKAAGVNDDKAARSIASEFADNSGNVQYSNNPGQIKYGGKNGTLSEAVLKAAEQYTFNPKNASTSTVPAQQQTGQTINIVINGKSTPVNVKSQQDADNLNAILRQLESDSNRSS